MNSFATAANLLDDAVQQVINRRADVGGSFSRSADGVWRLMPSTTGEGFGDFRLIYEPRAELPVGTRLVFECEMRAVGTDETPAAGQAGILLDVTAKVPGTGKYRPVFRHVLLAGPEWEKFLIPIVSDAEVPGGEWQVVLATEHFEQALEMRGLVVRPLAPNEKIEPSAAYDGQRRDAPWRAKARKLIEQHRKADFSVRVVDQFGTPVQGAAVSFEQTRHAYLFGTSVVASRLVDAEITFRDPNMTREEFLRDNARYREELLRLFNFAVFENDLKWPQWSGERSGSFSQNATMAALQWLRDRNIPVKGHTLVWASWRQAPDWLKELKGDKPALQQAILRHIRDVAAATGPFTSYWDVLNEPMSHRDIIELLGNEAVAEWFRTARESLPGQKLVLNDFDLVGNGGRADRRTGVLALIDDLKSFGVAPDVLACQAHFWSNRLTPPEQIWKIIDELHSQTGLPIAVTEFDINFPNDRLQADYTRDFLTAWFAHPATDSFIMWGFWGGAHWFGERGAMFRRDWTAKPNLEAYENLVFKEWWTKTNGTTDKDGRFKVRGFQGDYVLQISLPGYQTTVRRPRLGKEGLSLEVVLHRAQVASSN